MILRDRIESCLRVLDKYHYVQCTTALPSARCSCGLHLVKSSLRANWHQLEAERDALAADLAAARLDEARRINGDLARAEDERSVALILLRRCRTILANMALENKDALFNRWPIKHEPLRADARNILPELAALLGVDDD